MNKINPALHAQLETLIQSMGYEFVGCEMIPQRQALTMRVYIDKADGLTIDNCSEVSRQVSAMMDVSEFIQSRYYLEVSSPGIDRPLFELAHFERYIGCRVKLKLHSPIEERRNFKGLITKIEQQDIYLLIDDTNDVVTVPYLLIEKANLIGDVRL